MTPTSSELKSLRVVSAVLAVIYLLLFFVTRQVDPLGYEPFWQHALASGLFLSVVLSSRTSWGRDHFEKLFYVAVFLTATWACVIAAADGFSGQRIALVATTLASLLFVRERWAIIGLATHIVLLTVVGLVVVAPAAPPSAVLTRVGVFLTMTVGYSLMRIRAREQLEASERNYRQLVQRSPVATVVVEGDRCVLVNETAQHQLGFYVDEPAEALPVQLDHPGIQTIEIAHQRQLRSFEVLVSKLDASADLRQLIFVDKTADRQAMALKDALVTTVSHELRTPLTGVIGAIGLLENGVSGPLTEAQLKLVELAQRNAKRLKHLVDELLELRSLEANALELKLVPVDVKSVAQSVMESLQSEASKHDIELALNASDPALEVMADATRLFQLLANLVSNAIKYGAPASTIDISCGQLESTGRISVRDRGPGVPESIRDRIFEPFVRAPEIQNEVPGTGLGLAIAYRYALAMQGSLSLESPEEGGARFVVELPLAQGATSTLSSDSAASKASSMASSR